MGPAGCGQISHWTEAPFCLSFLGVRNVPEKPVEATTKLADMPFEEALKRIETIVSEMEAEDLPLERLLASYEEGMKLAKVCQGRLAEAELKIQQVEKTAGGDFKLKNFPADKPVTD